MLMPALIVHICVRLADGNAAVADRDASFTNRTSNPAPRRGFMNQRAPPPKFNAEFHESGTVIPGVLPAASALLVTFDLPSPALR